MSIYSNCADDNQHSNLQTDIEQLHHSKMYICQYWIIKKAIRQSFALHLLPMLPYQMNKYKKSFKGNEELDKSIKKRKITIVDSQNTNVGNKT